MTDYRYEIDCQDDATHGAHEAEFSHVNEYNQRIYVVECGTYTERYSEEVVRKVVKVGRVFGSQLGVHSEIVLRDGSIATIKRLTRNGAGAILADETGKPRTMTIRPDRIYKVANASAHS